MWLLLSFLAFSPLHPLCFSLKHVTLSSHMLFSVDSNSFPLGIWENYSFFLLPKSSPIFPFPTHPFPKQKCVLSSFCFGYDCYPTLLALRTLFATVSIPYSPLAQEFFVGRDCVQHHVPSAWQKKVVFLWWWIYMCCSPTARLRFYKQELYSVHLFFK